MTTTKHPRLWRAAQIIAILYIVLWFGLGYYANHSFPHGPDIHTGEYGCENDGRGPCGEITVEDTRHLNVPDWVKFIRDRDGELIALMIGMWILAFYAEDRLKA